MVTENIEVFTQNSVTIFSNSDILWDSFFTMLIAGRKNSLIP